jgi:hypothetical protein
MNVRVQLAGFLVLAVIVLVQASWAQGVTVSGSVRDRNNNPKAYVSVTFEGPRRYVAMTDGEGRYTITNVQNGSYSVVVRQGDNVQRFSQRISGQQEVNLVVQW